jgi:hypothetical protein
VSAVLSNLILIVAGFAMAHSFVQKIPKKTAQVKICAVHRGGPMRIRVQKVKPISRNATLNHANIPPSFASNRV